MAKRFVIEEVYARLTNNGEVRLETCDGKGRKLIIVLQDVIQLADIIGDLVDCLEVDGKPVTFVGPAYPNPKVLMSVLPHGPAPASTGLQVRCALRAPFFGSITVALPD